MNKRCLLSLLPLIFVVTASFGYAKWTSTVTKNYTLKAGSVDLEIVKWEITAYKGFSVCEIIPVENGGIVELIVKAEPVIPGWLLNWYIIIENAGTCPVDITKDIWYNNALFFVHLSYYDGFYKDLDGDGIYTDSVSPPFRLDPGETVMKSESLGPWTAQEHPELQGFEFEMVITVTGTQADP